MAPTSEVIKLKARANELGVSGWKTMTVAELKTAIGAAEGMSALKPAKSSARKSTVTKASGRKTASSSTGRKSAAKPKPAAKPAAKRTATGSGSRSKAPVKSASRKVAAGKTPPVANVKPTRGAYRPGRNTIDNSQIDWQAEWAGGKTGNRAIVLKSLRKFKGNKDKVFNALQPNAQAMFPKDDNGKKRSKASAEALLRWTIGRVAFDFTTGTGQHKVSTNRKNSVQGASQPVSRAKASGTGRKSTPKPATRQKPAQGRTRKAPAKAGVKKATGRKTTKARR